MSIEPRHPDLSVARQCELLDLPRSSYYFAPAGESPENLALMRRIDAQYLKTPFFGSRQMTAWLRRQGHAVNRKRVQRLMRLMGLQGAVPGPHTSRPHPSHPVYPVPPRPHAAWPLQPGVVDGYHLRADAGRVPVPGRHHRLVQPLCARLGLVQHPRHRLLPGGAR